MKRYVVELNVTVKECSSKDDAKFVDVVPQTMTFYAQGGCANDAMLDVQESIQRLVRNSW